MWHAAAPFCTCVRGGGSQVGQERALLRLTIWRLRLCWAGWKGRGVQQASASAWLLVLDVARQSCLGRSVSLSLFSRGTRWAGPRTRDSASAHQPLDRNLARAGQRFSRPLTQTWKETQSDPLDSPPHRPFLEQTDVM